MSIFALVFILSIFGATAQSSKQQSLKLIKYKDNINAPLSVIEKAFIKEVYADKYNEYIVNRPQKLKDLKNLLRNRITIKKMPDVTKHTKKYTLLSEAGLFNSYNKALTFDKKYVKNSFNVLKYNLNFFGRGTKTYRIDGTPYFIIIKSQHY